MTAVAFIVILILGIMSLCAGVVLTILDVRQRKSLVAAHTGEVASGELQLLSFLPEFWMIVAAVIAGLAIALLFGWAGTPWLLAVLLGTVAALYAPAPLEREWRRRSERAVLENTADAIDGFISLVSSGSTPEEAIASLAQECDEPMRSEFQRIQDRVAEGETLIAALEGLRARVASPDLDLFVAALQAQGDEIGGAPIAFTVLYDTIAKRRELRHRAAMVRRRSLRMSVGIALAGSGLLAVLGLLAPLIVSPLFVHPVGRFVLAVGVCGLIAKFLAFYEFAQRKGTA